MEKSHARSLSKVVSNILLLWSTFRIALRPFIGFSFWTGSDCSVEPKEWNVGWIETKPRPPLFLAQPWNRVLFTKWMPWTDEQLCRWTVFSLCFESQSKILLKRTYCYMLIHYPFKLFILQFFFCYRPRRRNPKPKRRLKYQRMFLSTPRKRKRQIPTRKDLTVTRKSRENLPRPLYRILWTY